MPDKPDDVLSRISAPHLQRYLQSVVGVPLRFMAAQLEHFRIKPKMNDNGLFIFGEPGSGKSYLSCAILYSLLPRLVRYESYQPGGIGGVSARWVYVPDLLIHLRSTYSRNSKSMEGAILNEYQNLSLLILDDVGAERETDWTQERLCVVIDRRLRDMKQTVVTSNLTVTEIHGRDPRLASRLSSLAQLRLDGDRRPKEGKGK